ncbi:hypothetical protein [Bradyrhizobium yuanmingense]|uniref:hypothetical protein n=1 Tax=Bradyrhizobium yuanmingense TaxID=108015 RepID=UPI0023B9834B|nr:hypothetical protein [Bradyrhizobium yuanmingense]MDF0492957.1 hypothetical protein [Bradyrhizobium yuanmingense]
MRNGDEPILVLHDTTEFSFKREKPDLIGFTRKTAGRTQCGILMHSNLAVTDRGASSRTGGNQVLDTQEVQGDDGAEAEDQSEACFDRAEGEYPLAGEFTVIDRPSRYPWTMRSYW